MGMIVLILVAGVIASMIYFFVHKRNETDEVEGEAITLSSPSE